MNVSVRPATVSFEAKRQFYAGVKTEMEHNLQLKTELCEAAEALSGSEEWKKATDELIALQARWKQVGAVSRRHSDAVWKRFRAACDRFFERKSTHFAGVDSEHEENLRRKLALLDEMAAADCVREATRSSRISSAAGARSASCPSSRRRRSRSATRRLSMHSLPPCAERSATAR